jgi:GDP-L-fucose synthase
METNAKIFVAGHRSVVGYPGEIVHDLTKPDGTPRKLMDVSKLHATGWKAKIGLEEGIRKVYAALETEKWN